jgi:hypothetical protein
MKSISGLASCPACRNRLEVVHIPTAATVDEPSALLGFRVVVEAWDIHATESLILRQMTENLVEFKTKVIEKFRENLLNRYVKRLKFSELHRLSGTLELC